MWVIAMKENCKDCKWWRGCGRWVKSKEGIFSYQQPTAGRCFRMPHTEEKKIFDDWCGEFEAKPK